MLNSTSSSFVPVQLAHTLRSLTYTSTQAKFFCLLKFRLTYRGNREIANHQEGVDRSVLNVKTNLLDKASVPGSRWKQLACGMFEETLRDPEVKEPTLQLEKRSSPEGYCFG
jgi:hypothetical protein